jgi:hypothetical protein
VLRGQPAAASFRPTSDDPDVTAHVDESHVVLPDLRLDLSLWRRRVGNASVQTLLSSTVIPAAQLTSFSRHARPPTALILLFQRRAARIDVMILSFAPDARL